MFSIVMLLGQAESGKSTLQKQFQLYYASHSLERERPLWRPIVYSNILKALQTILNELDHQFGGGSSPEPTPSTSAASSSTSFPIHESAWPEDLAQLRTNLQPLLDSEDALASEVSGGIRVGGGRSGVYVRAGWQALITPSRILPLSDIRDAAAPSVATNDVSRLLFQTQDDVAQFWAHPAVRKMVSTNRVHLEESTAL